MLKIEIETDNEVFNYPNGNNEIKRILSEVVKKIQDGRTKSLILDSNGNTVGNWEFSSIKTDIFDIFNFPTE